MATARHYGLYVATLSDRFSDLGLVGVVVVRRDPPGIVIEDVVMSCRAMGFGLEQLMLRRVLEAEAPWSTCRGLVVPTEKNGPVRDLFSEAGFRSGGEGEWVLCDIGDAPPAPSWLNEPSRVVPTS